MATSTLDFLTYDLSNTMLADAVKHARQTKANKAKWTNVVSQMRYFGKYGFCGCDNIQQIESENEINQLNELWSQYDPENFDYYDGFVSDLEWLGSRRLSEALDDTNYYYENL